MESRGELLGVSFASVPQPPLPADFRVDDGAAGSDIGSRSIGTGFKSDAIFWGGRKDAPVSTYTLVDSFWAAAEETPHTGAGEPGIVSSHSSIDRDSLLLVCCCLSDGVVAVVVAAGVVDSESGAASEGFG